MDTADHPLKTWRKRRNLTQTALGNAVGVGPTQISMIEQHKRGASFDVAVKIVKLSKGDVPLESLMQRETAAAPANSVEAA